MNRRIKDLRNALGLTQNAFASQINLSQNFIWLIEKGERIPSDRTLDDICRVYGVNRRWLETGEGEMFKPISAAEQVNRLMNEVIRTDGSESWQAARKTIIEALAEMPPEFWEQAAKLIEEIKNR